MTIPMRLPPLLFVLMSLLAAPLAQAQALADSLPKASAAPPVALANFAAGRTRLDQPVDCARP